MAYYINDEEVNQYEFQEELLGALENCCDESFEEFLDEVTEPIEIMGITYDASFVLKNVDPIAYDICKSEYIDNLYQDKIYLIENGEDLTIDGDVFMMIETLSYDETIDVMRQYGKEMYKFFYEADELFAGQNTKEALKKLEANPFVNEYQLLDKQAKADYMNAKFKPYFKGECL